MSWTIKKVEHQRIDAFKLWCWRRFCRVPWTARRSNQSILKEINPEYSLEGLMLRLKLQFFGYLMWRADSLDKNLMLGKTEGRRRRGKRGWDGWMASLTQWTWVWASSGRWWRTRKLGVLQSMGLQRVRHNLSTEQLWEKWNRIKSSRIISVKQCKIFVKRSLYCLYISVIHFSLLSWLVPSEFM